MALGQGGRVPLPVGCCPGVPLARRSPRRSTKPVLQSTSFLEKHKPEPEPEDEGSIFLYIVYFLIPLIDNCSAQRDSKARPRLQEMEWGPDL